VVTGVQPGSTGTVVVVVVGTDVVEGPAVVEEMEDPRLVLAPEQEASSNEVSIDTTRTVRVAQPNGSRRVTASVRVILPVSRRSLSTTRNTSARALQIVMRKTPTRSPS
jgi:hypothetical protein